MVFANPTGTGHAPRHVTIEIEIEIALNLPGAWHSDARIGEFFRVPECKLVS